MMDNAAVRNSRILGVFDEILHNADCSMRAVEIAGQGIAAEARCSLVLLADKDKRYDDPPEVAIQRAIACSEQLVALGGIEDDLVEIWTRRLAGQSDGTALERELQDVVLRLEAWTRHWLEMTSAMG